MSRVRSKVASSRKATVRSRTTETMAFTDVQALMERYGYLLIRVEGSHRVFAHADRDHPTIILPLRGRRVDLRHVRAMERILVESGVVPAREFRRRKAG